MRVILTGATGFVGEGVLLSLLQRTDIEKVLSVSRRSCEINHPKLEEYIVADFMDLPSNDPKLQGYDACFFCAGKSNFGLSREQYYHLSYQITLHFAAAIGANPDFVFIYLSGAGTSSHSLQFWSRTKAKAETDLRAVGFKAAYGFRPAGMKPVKGQRRLQGWGKYHWLFTWIPGFANTIEQVTDAMVICARDGYSRPIIEVSDINKLTK
ncbi:MAG: NAD-dependent epimerase/dehydratase family protein [Alistipes sp.]|nr:NAD-dependent epimerase/dehydratase family protein [Alistipes sp.]